VSQNLKLLFYLKKPKAYESGELPVFLRITIAGKRSELFVGKRIELNLWDHKRGRAKGNKEEIRQFNYHLDIVISKINQNHTAMLACDDEITADTLRDVYLGKTVRSKPLIEIFGDHNDEMERLIGNGFSDNTLRTFKSSMKHITDFLKISKKPADLGIRQVNTKFIREYDVFLRTKHQPCTPISAAKYITHLKKIVLLSLSNGWIKENPFQHYKSTAKATVRTFLTLNELTLIEQKKINVERVKQVRDIFVFCCYTGLAYVDIKKLKPAEIGIGDDGKLWIFTNRHKTGTAVHLPLLPAGREMLEAYKDHPYCQYHDVVFPVLANQRMNTYLKEIADICGITKTLTFHMARHTFATTIALSNGVPIETVSKMLGHNSIKTTQHYAKVLDAKTASDMEVLSKKLSGNVVQATETLPEPKIEEMAFQGKVVNMYSR
jgi:site-specific recombinase XerD